MLSQLYISNIAVIEKVSIDFENGFTILTGETGAGKSIIIDAINAILGERTSKGLVRTGAKNGTVTAMFSSVDNEVLDILSSMDIPLEEDTLIIFREIKAEGKTSCKINGYPVSVSTLKTIGEKLISIHGQHESYELLSPDAHINYIDSFADLENLRDSYAKSFTLLKNIQKRLSEFNEDEGLKARRIDMLKFQINEITAADIRIGEQEELTQERDALRNSERIMEAVNLSKLLLLGDEMNEGILAELSTISGEIEDIEESYPDIREFSHSVNEALSLLEDADISLRSLDLDFDISTLDEIEERLDLIYRLCKKYGGTESAILKHLEKLENELHSIEFSDEEKEKLEKDYESEKKTSISLAKELSAKRKEAAKLFSNRVKQELLFLNMPNIEFEVEIERIPLNIHGCDKVQFLISPNKGEPLKPMSKIASGGELSRIMLSIKTVLAGRDKIDTLIFDEVDTGISGEAAVKVGEKLKQVSKNRQVICITHLPQIAALADNHLLIEKHIKEERTFTEVTELDLESRKRELARIIGGDEITELKLKIAEEMLENKG